MAWRGLRMHHLKAWASSAAALCTRANRIEGIPDASAFAGTLSESDWHSNAPACSGTVTAPHASADKAPDPAAFPVSELHADAGAVGDSDPSTNPQREADRSTDPLYGSSLNLRHYHGCQV